MRAPTRILVTACAVPAALLGVAQSGADQEAAPKGDAYDSGVSQADSTGSGASASDGSDVSTSDGSGASATDGSGTSATGDSPRGDSPGEDSGASTPQKGSEGGRQGRARVSEPESIFGSPTDVFGG